MSTKPGSKRRATVVVWVVLFALGATLAFTTRAPAVIGLVAGFDAALVLAALARWLRLGRTPTVALLGAALAGAAVIGYAVGGRDAGQGAFAGALIIPAVIAVMAMRAADRPKQLAALAARCAAGEVPNARALARFATWPIGHAIEAARVLAAHDRLVEAEAVVAAIAADPKTRLDRAAMLVELRIARGELAAARAAVDEIRGDALAAEVAEVPAILDARVRIADGEAKQVATELAREPSPRTAAVVREMRLLARADACVAKGDANQAATIVGKLVERNPKLLAVLVRARRPLASVARELAAAA